MENCLKNALRIMLRSGFKVFPVDADERPNKVRWRRFDRLNEEHLLDEDCSGFGIKCGSDSMLVVICLYSVEDRGVSGVKWWNEVVVGDVRICQSFDEERISLPLNTTCVLTGNGDFHIYYRYDEDRMFNLGSFDDRRVGMSFKSNGDYVAGPGSFNRNGEYSVVLGLDRESERLTIADIPQEILDAVMKCGAETEHKSLERSRIINTQPHASRSREIYPRRIETKYSGRSNSFAGLPRDRSLEDGKCLDRGKSLSGNEKGRLDKYWKPTPRSLKKLINGISPERARKFQKEGIQAIQDVTESYDWDMNTGLELALFFASKVEDYDEEAIVDEWNRELTKERMNVRPDLEMLKLWLREDSPEDYLLLILSQDFPATYDERYPYDFQSFEEDIRNGHQFDSKEEAWEYIVRRLSLCARFVNKIPKKFIIKQNNDPYAVCSMRFVKQYDDMKCEYPINGKFQYMSILDPLRYDRRLTIRDYCFFPVSPIEKIKEKPGYLNLFRGFEAKTVYDVDMKAIQSILDHIFWVWSSENEDSYNYIISWMASVVQKPRELSTALIIKGPPGCGKSIVGDMLTSNVFGKGISSSESTLDGALSKYNGYLERKLLCVVHELNKTRRLNSDILKSLITDRYICMEKKGENRKGVDNYLHFLMFSNDYLKIEDGDRRFSVFECPGELISGEWYFKYLYKCCSSQYVANHFFTYLLNYKITADVLSPMMTEVKREMIRESLPAEKQYIEELKSGDWNMLHMYGLKTVYRDSNERRYISSEHFYNDYKKWFSYRGMESRMLPQNHFGRFLSSVLGREQGDNKKNVGGKNVRVNYIESIVTPDNEERFDELEKNYSPPGGISESSRFRTGRDK